MKQSYERMINPYPFKFEGGEAALWLQRIDEAINECKYIVDPDNDLATNEIIVALARTLCWITRSPEPKTNYITPKSFLLFGNPGTGKTFLMEIFTGRFNGIQLIDTARIDREIQDNKFGFWSWFRQWDDTHLVIDDIGAETNIQTIRDTITHREKLWRKTGIQTIYTTNLKNRDELEAKYSTRIKSRLLGQCNTIKLTGPDRRQT